MSVAQIRKDYRLASLRRRDLNPDPVEQFRLWMRDAIHAGGPDPTAMTLATAGKDLRVSARTVLLKGVDARGFAFYTNLTSRKARELKENPHAALVFYWPSLERQICVNGPVSELPREEAETYFRTRPLGNQLGAWVSSQSNPVATREVLEARLEQVRSQFEGLEIPMPPHWGGYRVHPEEIQFWQGRPNRLHDRFRYLKTPTGDWQIDRLEP
jgi:pyridoxamine 5'-phosphate oxidase